MAQRKKPKPEECNRLGAYFYRVGQTQLAIEQFRLATRKAPHASSYWANLGAALMDVRDLSGSEAALRKALELDPRDQGALFAMGQLAERGQAEEAMEFYRRVVEITQAGPFGRRAYDRVSGWHYPGSSGTC